MNSSKEKKKNFRPHGTAYARELRKISYMRRIGPLLCLLLSLTLLRANVNMHQTNSGKSPTFVFSPTFIFCSPICPYNCGVVFFWKYILVFEKWFSVRPLKYANFHREYSPSCVTSCNEFTWSPIFLSTISFVLSSELNPLSLLKLAKKYFFFGEYFCPTYFFYVEK